MRVARGTWALLAMCGLLLAGCATLPTASAVPEKLADEAMVAGMPMIRTWGDIDTATADRFLAAEGAAIVAKYRERAAAGGPLVSNILALSGGADDGAFGAGLLVGWGEHGDRPGFDLVTGVSAGALIAPFAFLGRDYDGTLGKLFTAYGEEDIYQANVLSGVLGGPAVASNAPLARLIARYVDAAMLARLAAERGRGRLLLVATTNLHAQRPVFWDIGKIAAMGGARALALVHNILLASAALPGIFPPVEIAVEARGQTYIELHVDGGPTREVFLSPTGFSFRNIDRALHAKVTRRLWVIRNGKIAPEYAIIQPTALAVATRSLETLTKSQGIGDLARIYETAQADSIDFNLAFIPATFTAPRPAPFARTYMTALYKEGLRLGRAGYQWAKVPPGFPEPAQPLRSRKSAPAAVR